MTNKNVINVNRLIHEYCKLKVSPGAVKEISGRIIDKLHDMAPDLDKIAKRHGRKTVMEEDVIEFFGYIEKDVFEKVG